MADDQVVVEDFGQGCVVVGTRNPGETDADVHRRYRTELYGPRLYCCPACARKYEHASMFGPEGLCPRCTAVVRRGMRGW